MEATARNATGSMGAKNVQVSFKKLVGLILLANIYIISHLLMALKLDIVNAKVTFHILFTFLLACVTETHFCAGCEPN